MRLLIAGGGTGGHLYPGVAVAEELLKRGDHKVLFAGSAQGIEARVLPKLGYDFSPVRCGPLVGRGAAAKLGALLKTLQGVADSLKLLASFKPVVCLGVGGYASFPVALAASLRGVPTAIEEQNATPGLANKVLSRVVSRIYTTDEAAASAFPAGRTLICGTPIRTGFSAPFPYEPPSSSRPTRVLVLGGSQGASSLNRLVPEAFLQVGHPLAIRHQAGRAKEAEVRDAYGSKEGVTVDPFIDDMAAAYSWAQIVIARAGALTLAELAGAGRPAILIPFPHAAGNHQEANARAHEAKGAGICLLEEELTASGLAKLVSTWIEKPALPSAHAENAAAAARCDAARLIVDDLLDLGKGG